jgi:2-hydroxycyclohexanecarboxyl-CoA dehydrogenase
MSGDRTAVVTGGAGGIGTAIADALAAAGVRVAVGDLDEARAQKVADEVGVRHERPTVGVGLDVGETASVRNALDQVESQLGPVDILVNNAGIDRIGPFVESREDDWDLILRVNLRGQFVCTRAVLDGMIERGYGRIVNIASDAGRVGSSGEAVYSAAKGGVIAFTKSVAREVARHGITVNCVCPGPTDTPLLGQVAEANEKLYASLTKAIPLRRIAEPRDIAPAVVFLAGDAAGYITGQTLSVSGGLTMA